MPTATLCTTNLVWTTLGQNLGLRSEWWDAYSLSCGMILRLWLTRHGLLVFFGSVLPRSQLHTDGVESGFV